MTHQSASLRLESLFAEFAQTTKELKALTSTDDDRTAVYEESRSDQLTTKQEELAWTIVSSPRSDAVAQFCKAAVVTEFCWEADALESFAARSLAMSVLEDSRTKVTGSLAEYLGV